VELARHALVLVTGVPAHMLLGLSLWAVASRQIFPAFEAEQKRRDVVSLRASVNRRLQ
jgi:hypothetical protein